MDAPFDLTGRTVASYCRVSTDKDDQLNSLDNQMSFFDNFAKKHKCKMYKVYSDQGLSGTEWTKRDAFNQMLRAAGLMVVTEVSKVNLKKSTKYFLDPSRDPKFSLILVKNTSRFARNTFSFEIILLLRQRGVLIFFLEQNLLTTSQNDFFLKLLQNFDENDSRDKSQKVKFGFREGARKGRIYTGRGLFGYDYDKKNNTLSQNPDAGTVKLIFDLYTEDEIGFRKIREELFKRGIKTAQGGDWGVSSIRNLLKNEKYAGYNNPLKFDAGAVLEGKTYSKVKDHYDVILCDGIEAIVTKGQFDKAQSLMRDKVDKFDLRGRKAVYGSYTRMLKCRLCGSFYIRNCDFYDVKRTRKYHFWICSRKKKLGISACKAENIKEDEVKEFIKRLAGGEIIEDLKSRVIFFKKYIADLAASKLLMLDEDKSKEAEALEEDFTKRKDELKALYKRASIRSNPTLEDMISECEEEVNEAAEKLRNAKSYNQKVLCEIEDIVSRFLELDKAAKISRSNLTESKVLDLIDSLLVNRKDEEPRLYATYKAFAKAEELLYDGGDSPWVKSWQGKNLEVLGDDDADRKIAYVKKVSEEFKGGDFSSFDLNLPTLSEIEDFLKSEDRD